MNKYITEFIGTFFLVFVIGLTVSTSTAFAPLAIGATLMVMVYMGGHISGGHYNPAVTLAALIRGAIGLTDALIYMVSQVLGGICAGLLTAYMMGSAITLMPSVGFSAIQALLIEIIFTFSLALTVLNVATSKDHPNNSFYGLAIGFSVVIAAFAGGPISGGAFNPAVALGQNLISGDLSNLWIYLIGPLSGGVLAAIVFKVTNPDDC